MVAWSPSRRTRSITTARAGGLKDTRQPAEPRLRCRQVLAARTVSRVEVVLDDVAWSVAFLCTTNHNKGEQESLNTHSSGNLPAFGARK
jgi:hypothetical protein